MRLVQHGPRRIDPGVLAGIALLFASGCSDRVEVGYDRSASGAGASGATGGVGGASGGAGGATGGAGAASGGARGCVQTDCRGVVYACGDCADNDSDGVIDALDPECLGPCDNSEDSYFGRIPGQNTVGCRQDCYFDKNAGAGNDRCTWSHTCDPGSVAPDFPPSGDASCAYDESAKVQGRSCEDLRASQPETCLGTCLPLTPNGCDCFGCCELPARSGNFVWLGSDAGATENGSCDHEHLADPEACAPCTPVRSCFNTCQGCEVCAGETAPAEACAATACDAGIEACGALAACPATFYCVTGCCVPAPR
jgi:hypothetical protein